MVLLLIDNRAIYFLKLTVITTSLNTIIKLRIGIFALFFINFSFLNAQTIIAGKVIDSYTEVGLENVKVKVKGANTGSITDQKGSFSISTDLEFPITLISSALGYATVDKLAEIQLPKFLDLSNPTNPVALIDTAVIGDWDGIGGLYNMESNLGYSNDIHMVCSMGGGIGDLSWLEAGDVPMCAVHCPTDPVAVYTTGDVAIASIGVVTTDISGSYDVIQKANILGNNTVFDPVNAGSDTYTLAAQAASSVAQGMMDFGGTTIGAPVDNVFPYITGNPYEASPWDFWDSTTTVYIALALGLPASQGTQAHVTNIAQNPDMSLPKSMAYMDSTLGYFCRRIVRATNLDGQSGIDELTVIEAGLKIYPNPANQNVTILSENGTINSIKMYSTAGKLVKEETNLSSNQVNLNNLNLLEGFYLCSIEVNGQMFTKRLVIR